jgi:WD40 repeat protein
VNENATMVVFKNDTFGTEDPLQLFRELSKLNSVVYIDAVFRWKEVSVSSFRAPAFSNDRFLFAAALDGGAILVFRALTTAQGAIAGYEQTAFAYPPINLITESPVLACAVSSHLFLACVGIGSRVFTYHVSSARFIRSITFSGPVCQLLINDTYQIIFGIGDAFIEVFTINGTLVAFTDVLDDRVTASSLSVNDVSVFLATGHESGKVTLWEVDPASQKMIVRKTLKTKTAILAVDVLREGSALIAVTAGREATVFCSRGIQESLFKVGSAIGCAGCGIGGHFTNCASCGLYFCGKCCQKTGRSKALCRDCLAHIEEYATIID